MSPLEFPNEGAWRYWRVRRAFSMVRMGLLGVFAGVLVHVLSH